VSRHGERTHSQCPKCGVNSVVVIDSRPSLTPGFHSIRRRRLCESCKHKFSTYEVPQEVLQSIDVFRLSALRLMDAVKILTSYNSTLNASATPSGQATLPEAGNVV